MRRSVLLMTVLVMLVGCSTGAAEVSPSPGAEPSKMPSDGTASSEPPTIDSASTPQTPTVEPPDGDTPVIPATCELAPLDFPVEPRIPPVSEDDHVHGPADAEITFLEYADFQ